MSTRRSLAFLALAATAFGLGHRAATAQRSDQWRKATKHPEGESEDAPRVSEGPIHLQDHAGGRGVRFRNICVHRLDLSGGE